MLAAHINERDVLNSVQHVRSPLTRLLSVGDEHAPIEFQACWQAQPRVSSIVDIEHDCGPAFIAEHHLEMRDTPCRLAFASFEIWPKLKMISGKDDPD